MGSLIQFFPSRQVFNEVGPQGSLIYKAMTTGDKAGTTDTKVGQATITSSGKTICVHFEGTFYIGQVTPTTTTSQIFSVYRSVNGGSSTLIRSFATGLNASTSFIRLNMGMFSFEDDSAGAGVINYNFYVRAETTATQVSNFDAATIKIWEMV